MTTLEAFDLSPDDTVRWRRRNRGTWKLGHPRGVNKDGSITLAMDGSIRALPAAELEVRRRGPRGGKVWHPVTPRNEPESA